MASVDDVSEALLTAIKDHSDKGNQAGNTVFITAHAEAAKNLAAAYASIRTGEAAQS